MIMTQYLLVDGHPIIEYPKLNMNIYQPHTKNEERAGCVTSFWSSHRGKWIYAIRFS
jgi:hypothetical protein